MPKCPKCGEEIEALIAWIAKEERCEISLNPDNTIRYEFTDSVEGGSATEYECPLCGDVVFKSKIDAEKFLKGEVK